MTYSYTQISQYLECPKRYRYRYVEGWKEKDGRATVLFGRAFEKAVAAYFRGRNPAPVLAREWSACRKASVNYQGESWENMLKCGCELLDQFRRDDRVRILQPYRNLQTKIIKKISATDDFVGYIDAIGELDSQRCVIDWKTSSGRYPDQPDGLLALDPQLLCYSWLTGEPHVAFVVFVRKRQPEIQYLITTITEDQRRDFDALIGQTVAQIESAQFPAHSGIRFPQNTCLGCPYVGLCLEKRELIDQRLVRRLGGDYGWLDELAC